MMDGQIQRRKLVSSSCKNKRGSIKELFLVFLKCKNMNTQKNIILYNSEAVEKRNQLIHR